MSQAVVVLTDRINRGILHIRGLKVMLDVHLAGLYDVSVKQLNQAVKRNSERFPADFMFQLDRHEVENLRSQFVTSSWGGRRYRPHSFTEQGIAMLSSVLRSRRAIRVNIEIMRAFVWLRQIFASNKALARRLDDMETKYDAQFKVVFDAIREMMEPLPAPSKDRIGFRPKRHS